MHKRTAEQEQKIKEKKLYTDLQTAEYRHALHSRMYASDKAVAESHRTHCNLLLEIRCSIQFN